MAPNDDEADNATSIQPKHDTDTTAEQPTPASITAKPTPTPSHPSASPPTPAVPFLTVIEADHTSLRHHSGQLLQASLPLTTRLHRLSTLLWRLVRHDISEELVMRPAFATHLGDEGVSAATQDRHDHADLKRRLLALHQQLSTATSVDEAAMMVTVQGLADEMGAHMIEESGVVLPRFAALLSPDAALELGAVYVRTLVLTPDVCVGDPGGSGGLVRCFDGLAGYLRADVGVFGGILRRLEDGAARGVDGGYLDRRVREELWDLRLLEDSCQGPRRDARVGKGRL